MESPWDRLRQALAEQGAPHPVSPPGSRTGAALALLTEAGPDLDLLLTRRCDHLPHHPGQVSFPGGRVHAGEGVVDAALREAREEVGLRPGTVEVLGRLRPLYIPPSRFWLHTVVARWRVPHPLHADEREVAELFSASLRELRDPACWRVTRLSSRGAAWAWRLADGHLLWGATALATVGLLDMLDPGWRGGLEPTDLGPEHEEHPWSDTDLAARGRR